AVEDLVRTATDASRKPCSDVSRAGKTTPARLRTQSARNTSRAVRECPRPVIQRPLGNVRGSWLAKASGKTGTLDLGTLMPHSYYETRSAQSAIRRSGHRLPSWKQGAGEPKLTRPFAVSVAGSF